MRELGGVAVDERAVVFGVIFSCCLVFGKIPTGGEFRLQGLVAKQGNAICVELHHKHLSVSVAEDTLFLSVLQTSSECQRTVEFACINRTNPPRILCVKLKEGITPTPTFLRRSPTILRAEILAEGVRDELPQPLVNAAQAHEPILVYKSVSCVRKRL